MSGQKDRRTDRPYFIGSFRLPPGVQKSLKAKDKETEIENRHLVNMNGICKIADAVYAMEKAIKERLGLKMRKPKKKGDVEKKN